MKTLALSVLVIATAACGGTGSNTAPTQVASPLSFFVTSATNPTGNLGGLRGDGLGPNGDTSGALSSWNSPHSNANCSNTAPRGGAGRIYCFAR